MINLLKKVILLISKNKILALILIIAALLRFVGTNPGYNQFHADEGISYSAAVSMIKNGNLDPLRYDYPALVPEINYIFFRTVFIPIYWAKYYVSHFFDIIDGLVHLPIAPLEKNKIFQIEILGERNLNAMHWGRYVTAFFSVLNVLLLYLLAKRVFLKNPTDGRGIGLVAAFLLTFNYKHVVNSHIGLPDIYNAFFVLLVLILCFDLWQKPSRKNYLLLGVAVGMSFAVKYQIFAIFPMVLTHLYLSFNRYRPDMKRLFNPNFFFGVMLVPITFAVLNPYFFIHFNKALTSVKDVSLKYGMGTNQLNLYPFSYFYHIDYGQIEFIAIIIGLILVFVRYKKETLIPLSFLIPYMFILVYYSRGGFYVRNFITVTPLFMMWAAVTFWYIYKLISEKKWGKRFGSLILIIILSTAVFIPGRNAIINSYYYSRLWNYDIMRSWVQENLPKEVIVASHPFDAVNLKITNKRTEFENAGAFSMQEHIDNEASYLVLDLNWVGYPFYFWMSYGIEDLALYWNKPLDIMRNMYHGLATEQLFRYQVHAVTKPWQAPDTHILIVKFPVWRTVEMSEQKIFTFDEPSDLWETYGKVKQSDESPFRLDSTVGRTAKGSLLYLPHGAKFPTVRATSPLIQIKEGYLYEIEGFIKTELELASREREGFLRIDFYGEDPNLEKIGIISSVSSRVWGSNDWVKKKITERAPVGAKYLTISLQTQITTKTKIWLDDVVVRESKDSVEDITTKSPYNIQKMDLNYVYPNSHGNL